MNNPSVSDEQLFKRKRTALYSVCILIFLLHANLSILLDKAFEQGFSKEQMDSLTGILFVTLLVTSLRYHQAVVTSNSWSKMMQEFHPYKRARLYVSGILLDRTREGESEYDDFYWAMADNDPSYISPYYTLEEDSVFKSSEVKKTKAPHGLEKWESLAVKTRIKFLVTRAGIKFSIDHPAVLDVVAPYIFSALTFLEITSILKISSSLEIFGHYLSETDKAHKLLSIFTLCPT